MESISVTKFLFTCIRPFRWWVVGQLLVGIIWAIDLSLRPYILKIMIDILAQDPSTGVYTDLMNPAIFYIGLSVVYFLTFRFYDYVWLNINPYLKRHIGGVLMDRMMQHAHHLFQENFAGSLGNKIKDVMSGIPDLLKTIIDQFFSHGLAFLIAIAAVWTVDAKYSLALFVWILVFIMGSSYLSKRGRQLSDDAAEVRSTVVGTIVDILSNMISVRLFAGRTAERNTLGVSLNQYVKADQKRDWFFLKMNAFQGLTFVVYQAVVLYWLVYGFQSSTITPGDFALILTVNIAIVNALWPLAKDILVFSELVGNISQGLRIVLSPLDIEDQPDAAELTVRKGEIVFSQVHFRYRDQEALFENKSVTIQPGQKVGLVGYSGGGKTTFVNLILRLFEVTGGHILIDGQDIKEVTQESLWTNIGMIPQEPSLFHRTIMENIRYGRQDATDEEVCDAAKKALAHDFITQLPKGYNSMVGERGVKLSSGQRQRIAIARVILKDAPLLVMDEATSQLDSVTESFIQNSLWDLMKNKTTIVIAHRLSTLLQMDRILVFDLGKIVEDGTHEELLARKGHYKKLWDTQVGGFLPESGDLEEE